MVWSFLEKFPNVQSAKFIKSQIQLQERKKDLQEHWPKCLAAAYGDVEKAKDMFVKIAINKPAWLVLVQTVDPWRRPEELRRDIERMMPSTSVSPPLPAAPTTGVMANLTIESSVPGADIEIDGAFVGNSPSTVAVAAGSHQIAVKKKGFTEWNRTLNVTGGTVHLNAELEQENPTQ